MVSRIFEAYAEEFASECASVSRALDDVREQSGAERRKAQSEAEAALGRADENVQQMELEARASSGPPGKEMAKKAKELKAELAQLRTALKVALNTVPTSARAELLGGSSGDEAGDDQRARLLKMGERMQSGTSKLEAATRTVLEAEAIGESVLGDLHAQRETILHATGTLQRANEGLERSKRTLNAIARRAFENKLIMYGIIAMLGIGVLFLGYIELFGFPTGGGGEDDDVVMEAAVVTHGAARNASAAAGR